MKRVGIIGGTFDPPHNGHLLIAEEVRSALSLEQIWFMPSNVPPHKERKVTDSMHRIEMVRRAIGENQHFAMQLIEFERDGRSYTIDTLKLLKQQHPDTEFFFIIGADMVEYLPKWHRIDELMEIVQFVGVKRPGYQFQTDYPVQYVDVPQFDVSSTSLRERFEKGRNTVYLLPDIVKNYIEENQLYGT
ncbi:nicotinate-nucleotide adenylyltransferase [Bacillus tianshenii]|nr:nicotinate-nucleotide adenylyltransferase [Bacillus tianshenii]